MKADAYFFTSYQLSIKTQTYHIIELVIERDYKGDNMKNVYIILVTLTIETVIIWFASFLLRWKFVDTIFLGSLLLFGIVYLFRLYIHQTNATFNANIAGWTWEEAGIGPFRFRVSPIILGLILFIVISFFVTLITYYAYFFSKEIRLNIETEVKW